MKQNLNKLQLISYSVTMLIALIILCDFVFPGNVFTEEVLEVKQTREQYYNAAANYHFSYQVITPKHRFYVSDEFAAIAEQAEIRYSVSLIFKEINRYGLSNTDESETYILRLLAGLAFPLIVILVIVIAYFTRKKISTLLFVLQALLIVDLVILIR